MIEAHNWNQPLVLATDGGSIGSSARRPPSLSISCPYIHAYCLRTTAHFASYFRSASTKAAERAAQGTTCTTAIVCFGVLDFFLHLYHATNDAKKTHFFSTAGHGAAPPLACIDKLMIADGQKSRKAAVDLMHDVDDPCTTFNFTSHASLARVCVYVRLCVLASLA